MAYKPFKNSLAEGMAQTTKNVSGVKAPLQNTNSSNNMLGQNVPNSQIQPYQQKNFGGANVPDLGVKQSNNSIGIGDTSGNDLMGWNPAHEGELNPGGVGAGPGIGSTIIDLDQNKMGYPYGGEESDDDYVPPSNEDLWWQTAESYITAFGNNPNIPEYWSTGWGFNTTADWLIEWLADNSAGGQPSIYDAFDALVGAGAYTLTDPNAPIGGDENSMIGSGASTQNMQGQDIVTGLINNQKAKRFSSLDEEGLRKAKGFAGYGKMVGR